MRPLLLLSRAYRAALGYTNMLGSTILKFADRFVYQVATSRPLRSLRRIRSASIARRVTIMSLVGGSLLLVSGCAQWTPSTPFFTPRGVIPMTAAPPAPAPGLQLQVGRFDGTYSGTASVLAGAGRCIGTQRVLGFYVRGDVARWQGFRGVIDPNGGVQMNFGIQWILGQFQENTFLGQLELGGSSRNDSSCVFGFALKRVGP